MWTGIASWRQRRAGSDPVRVVAVCNFLIFVAVASALGGDALNGGGRHGAYWLGMHGHRHPVSHAVWTYSLLHESVTIILMLVALARGLDRRRHGGAAADEHA